MTDNQFRIEASKRIDVRCYWVIIKGQRYVLDFANPRDVRYYFPGLFPKFNSQWRLYDLGDTELKSTSKLQRIIFSHRINQIALKTIILLLLFDIFLAPSFINIATLTKDVRILHHWQLVIMLTIIALLLSVLLNTLLLQIKIPKNSPLMILRKVDHQSKNMLLKIPTIIRWPILMSLLLGTLCLIGIGGSNYAQLILFLIIPVYSMFFGRFTTQDFGKNHDQYLLVKQEKRNHHA